METVEHPEANEPTGHSEGQETRAYQEENGAAPVGRPYIGPRSFRAEEAHLFFGRDREARELAARIISNRLVLVYARSGAGKSSLLNAGIKPPLEEEGFEVLPIGRVSGAGGGERPAQNIFIYNLQASLTDEVPDDVSLIDFLDNLVEIDGTYAYRPDYEYDEETTFPPRVLIIDQFEEIFTTNTFYWEQRTEFFRQLDQALERDDFLWVVLSIRVDFVAALDPYMRFLPVELLSRFYLEPFTPAAALEAIRQPAELGGRPFEGEAAELLVDNLRAIPGEDGQEERLLGQYVESVELQTVCKKMWTRAEREGSDTITVEVVEEFADATAVLQDVYEETIAEVVADTHTDEYALRNWFESELITKAGTRKQVVRGASDVAGLPVTLIDRIVESDLFRQIERPGSIRYELAHDQFVGIIRDANAAWLLARPYLKLAMAWDGAKRPESMLLEGQQLQQLLASDWEKLGPVLRDFVKESEALAKKIAQEKEETESLVRQLSQEKAENESVVRRLTQEKAETESRVRQLTNEKAETESRVRQLAQEKEETETRVRLLAQEKEETETRVRQLIEEKADTESRLTQVAPEKQESAAAGSANPPDEETAAAIQQKTRSLRRTRRLLFGIVLLLILAVLLTLLVIFVDDGELTAQSVFGTITTKSTMVLQDPGKQLNQAAQNANDRLRKLSQGAGEALNPLARDAVEQAGTLVQDAGEQVGAAAQGAGERLTIAAQEVLTGEQSDIKRITIKVNNGSLQFEIPATWSETIDGPAEVSGFEATWTAIPDNQPAENMWQTPWIFIGIGNKGEIDSTQELDAVLDGHSALSEHCDFVKREVYRRSSFEGLIDFWTGCGEAVGSIELVVVPIDGDTFEGIVAIKSTDESERAVRERLLDSLRIEG